MQPLLAVDFGDKAVDPRGQLLSLSPLPTAELFSSAANPWSLSRSKDMFRLNISFYATIEPLFPKANFCRAFKLITPVQIFR